MVLMMLLMLLMLLLLIGGFVLLAVDAFALVGSTLILCRPLASLLRLMWAMLLFWLIWFWDMLPLPLSLLMNVLTPYVLNFCKVWLAWRLKPLLYVICLSTVSLLLFKLSGTLLIYIISLFLCASSGSGWTGLEFGLLNILLMACMAKSLALFSSVINFMVTLSAVCTLGALLPVRLSRLSCSCFTLCSATSSLVLVFYSLRADRVDMPMKESTCLLASLPPTPLFSSSACFLRSFRLESWVSSTRAMVILSKCE
mmetsp:Transcript_13532/g.29315  ORF Transcript_13532/g.29315 Transcript_13532/m.29315 type:complete len:255 (-) Transcript_13532:527-1291(-)